MEQDQVAVATATVEIKTLMIGERQVTAGIIRQIPREWWGLDDDPPPWVRFGCKVAGPCSLTQEHHHFLWVTHDGELRQDATESLNPAAIRSDLVSAREQADDHHVEREQAERRRKRAVVSELPYIYAAGMR